MTGRDSFLAGLSSLLSGGEGDPFRMMTVLSNASAYLFERLPDVSWVGFYLRRGGHLYLGPFQGKVACTKIALGKGVCGTAAVRERTIVVSDVHQFPGHIACDSASRSEMVVPLMVDGTLIGVLDLDSTSIGRFTGEDASLLEKAAQVVTAHLS